MDRLRWLAVSCRFVVCTSLIVLPEARAQPVSAKFPRLHILAEIGPARGAGNRFTDVAITGGLRVNRVDLRLRLGSFVFLGGCDAIVPTKCGVGSDGYFDAALAVHAGRDPGRVGGWTFAVGPGVVRQGHRAFVSAALGRDMQLGHRGLIRVELHGRHVFDDYYRATWQEPHRQFGVRVGIGLWSAVDRL